MWSSSLYFPNINQAEYIDMLDNDKRRPNFMIFVVLDYYFFQVFKKYNYVNATIYDSKMPQTSIQKHQTKFYHFHEFCNTRHIEKKFNIWKWKRSKQKSEHFMSLEVVKKNRLMHELYKSFFSSCQRVWRQFFNKFSRFCIG